MAEETIKLMGIIVALAVVVRVQVLSLASGMESVRRDRIRRSVPPLCVCGGFV